MIEEGEFIYLLYQHDAIPTGRFQATNGEKSARGIGYVMQQYILRG